MSSLIDLALVLALCALGAAAVWGMLRFITAAHDSRKVGAIGFAVAFATFAAVGATIRLQDNDEPPPALTVGDVVRPNLQGTLPTRTGIEEWKSAFDGFELQWPADDAPRETERPNDVITFDDDFDGYIAGEVEQDGVRAVAFIGFEDDEISWFTCHVSGYGAPGPMISCEPAGTPPPSQTRIWIREPSGSIRPSIRIPTPRTRYCCSSSSSARQCCWYPLPATTRPTSTCRSP
ncbi:hypothetical protein GCM10029992_28200 [Glycomyces albus]